MDEQLGELARTGHARLVEDHHRARRQAVVAAEPQVLEQRSQAGRLDPGAVLELVGGAPGDGRPDHRVAVGLPRLARRIERERLAGPGLAGHELHAVAGLRQPAHHRRLLVAERRAALERRGHARLAHDAGTLIAARERALDQLFLDGEQLGRRVAAFFGGGRDHPPVRAPNHVAVGQPAHVARQRQRVLAVEERVGERLGHPYFRALREPVAPGLDHLAPGEARALARQPLRRAKLSRRPLDRFAGELLLDRASGQLGEPLPLEAEPRRLLAPTVAERLGADAVVLRLAGVERRHLCGLGGVLAALGQRPLDLRRRRLNARSTGCGIPTMSAAPLWTGPHSTPRRRTSSWRSFAW